METLWQERKLAEMPDNAVITGISNRFGISFHLAELLVKRGFDHEEAIMNYLRPDEDNMYNPFDLPDMDAAVDRLIEACEKKEKVLIYGDYDVDGTTATAMLLKYFRKIGLEVSFRIPNRLKEGYGMNVEALKEAVESGFTLIVTVDNGIAAFDEVEYLNAQGIDIIITDHHEWQGRKPNALAVVDAKLPDSEYPFSELCGAGVALKLIQALDLELDLDEDRTEFIEMAALATIADIVPLEDENRIIAALGIGSMNQGAQNSGIRALVEISEVQTVTAGNIGYVIAPKINAAGRLGVADSVITLFTDASPQRIYDAAVFLKDENEKRQEIESAITESAIAQVIDEKLDEKAFLVVVGKNWHSGVIGIVASRLQEKWYRPTIVLGVDSDGMARGSCRSIPGVDIFDALCKTQELLETFGGHEQAAGLSIREENIEAFRNALETYGEAHEVRKHHVRKMHYDMVLDSEDASEELLDELELLEPCGYGNPAPVFKITVDHPGGVRRIGKENTHLSFSQDALRFIAFDACEKEPAVRSGSSDVLCKLKRNIFNGMVSVQGVVSDIKTNILKDNRSCWDLMEALKHDDEKGLQRLLDFEYEELAPEREHYVKVFRSFTYEKFSEVSFDALRNMEPKMNSFQLLFCLNVLKQCDLIDYRLRRGIITAQKCKNVEKKDIQKAPLVLKLKLTFKQKEQI